MGFYSLLSTYYDHIFPVPDQKLGFFLQLWQQNNADRVLDLACGSGLLARKLAKQGLRVTGIDLEEEMIVKARQAAAAEDSSVDFRVGDMRDAGGVDGEYDGAICVGNSLAHLLDKEDILRTLQAMGQRLRPGGILVIQIVNFDRILAQGPTDLPDVVRSDVGFAFYRRYVPQASGLVEFQSRFITLPDQTEHTNSINLRAIRQEELAGWLQDIGFTDLRFYGGFDKSPYAKDSYATVVTAVRP